MRIEELIAFLVVVAVIGGAIAAGFWLRARNARRSVELREGFGPEYERALAEYGGKDRAERELAARQRRVAKLSIRLLTPDERDRFGSAWAAVQQKFVDDPRAAVVEADRLVKSVMATRGYPMDDFEQRVADLSVDHAGVVQHYRAARMLAQANAEGRSTTEDLRQAMVHYRSLFGDLLETYQQPVGEPHEVRA